MAENEPSQPGGAPQKPKIIIDDDWKAQARAEKEKLAEQVEGKPGEGGAAAAGRRGGPREIPPASFSTLVSSLVTQTFYALGGMEDRRGRRYVDLDVAKHHIDTLVILEEKTKGNLAPEEQKMLDQGLYECRMQYVNVAQLVAQQGTGGSVG